MIEVEKTDFERAPAQEESENHLPGKQKLTGYKVLKKPFKFRDEILVKIACAIGCLDFVLNEKGPQFIGIEPVIKCSERNVQATFPKPKCLEKNCGNREIPTVKPGNIMRVRDLEQIRGQ